MVNDKFLYQSIILNKEECNFIKEYILKNEEKVKSLGPDVFRGTADNSLSGRHTIFNWLNTDIGNILIPKIRIIIKELRLQYPIAVQCWANTFRKGEGIDKHNHSKEMNFICSHLFICGDENIGTHYFVEEEKQYIKRKNIQGEINVFDSKLPHYVPNNPTDEIRISVAMDIYPSKDIGLGQWDDEFLSDDKRFYIIEDRRKNR